MKNFSEQFSNKNHKPLETHMSPLTKEELEDLILYKGVENDKDKEKIAEHIELNERLQRLVQEAVKEVILNKYKKAENLEKVQKKVPDFETQFKNREHFEVAGGMAEVVDIIPEKLKDEVPVFIAPAWTCGIDVYKQFLEIMSDDERRSIAISHPRKGGNLEKQATKEEIEKYPKEELRKAFNILNIIEKKNLEKVDVLAHSEGAINITIAAMMHPEKFRNIIYFAPAGMIGKDDFLDLLKRALSQNRGDSLADEPITEKEKMIGETALKLGQKYLLENPLRALKESYEISQFQILEMVRYLHDKGIGIVVMSGIDDPLFRTMDLQKMVKMDMIDGFMTMRGGHGAIGEQRGHIIWAEKMLTALKSQEENKVESQKPDLRKEFF